MHGCYLESKRQCLNHNLTHCSVPLSVKESRQLEHKKKQRVSFEEDGGGTKDTPTENESPQSDAILNCPACMTTLCLDCQR